MSLEDNAPGAGAFANPAIKLSPRQVHTLNAALQAAVSAYEDAEKHNRAQAQAIEAANAKLSRPAPGELRQDPAGLIRMADHFVKQREDVRELIATLEEMNIWARRI
jgi:hypothetical protein